MDKRKVTIAVIVMLVLARGRLDVRPLRSAPIRSSPRCSSSATRCSKTAIYPKPSAAPQWENFRQRMDGLTDAQRDALRDGGRERWQQFAQQRMDEFFKLPPAEQNKRLDDMIDRMLARQKERAAESERQARADAATAAAGET